MLWFGIALGIILLLVLLSWWLDRLYRNPRKANQNTPETVGISYQEVEIPTKNNRRLHGWWIPAEGQGEKEAPTLILVHGWGHNAEKMLPYIEALHPEGYNLLAFDARNHGTSDTDGPTTMLGFAQDIMATIDYLLQANKASIGKIGVIGFSIGGAATIYATANDRRISRAVSIGAFSHPRKIMLRDFKKYHIPYFPFGWFLFKIMEFRIGFTFDSIAPENHVGKINFPYLLIHGEKDRVVPPQHAREILQAGNPKLIDLWIVPGKGHSDCHTHPDFWERINQYFRPLFQGSS